MGEKDLRVKLGEELDKEIHEEIQVIYILSRIRKLLETKNFPSKYKHLNFYCNWALHTKIDRAEPISEVLREFTNGSDSGSFILFDPLAKELRMFLKEYEFSNKIFV